MELTGKIKLINDIQTFDSGFQKREFVVTTQEQYPQDVKFEVVKDKCSLLDKFSAGSDVKVSFNIRGNEYNGKYFVNLQAWKIDADNSAPGAQPAAAGNSGASFESPIPEGGDDLPF
jgi:hypothetical protein